MIGAVRTTPIRLQPLVGEAFDSWLEALAIRLQLPMGHMIAGLGLLEIAREPGHDLMANGCAALPDWTVRLSSAETTHLSAVTGLEPATVHAMTLERFDARAVVLVPGRRQVDRTKLWSRGTGSRFCPRCLAEDGGRWQLSWRLGWSFACLRHNVLLIDSCPSCQQVPRERTHSPLFQPEPARCALNHPGTAGWQPAANRCGHRFTTVEADTLTASSPLLHAQAVINEWLDDQGSDRPPAPGCYGPDPVSCHQFLSDLRAIAIRVLTAATDDDLARWAPPDIVDRARRFLNRPTRTGEQNRPGVKAPSDSGAAGIALAAALEVMTCSDVPSAAERIRWLAERLASSGAGLTPSTRVKSWGRYTSPTLHRVLHHSIDGRSLPVRWLRHRASLPDNPPPARAAAQHSARIPALFWPTLSVRLVSEAGAPDNEWRNQRHALSVCLFIAGTGLKRAAAIAEFGVALRPEYVSKMLRTLAGGDKARSGLHLLADLARQLRETGSPIDYARRRELFGATEHLMDPRRWDDLQRHLRRGGTPPPVRYADQWLFEELTGSSAASAHPAIAFSGPKNLPNYLRFRMRLLPDELKLLHTAAEEIVEGNGLNEPTSWEPSLDPEAEATLRVLRTDLAAISTEEVLDLYWAERLTPADIGRRMGTSTVHIRHLLEQRSLDWRPPKPQRPAAQAISTDRWQPAASLRARNEQWRESYVAERRSAVEIAQTAGVSPGTVNRALRLMGVNIRPANPVVSTKTKQPAPSRHEDRLPEIVERYRAGQSVRTISRATGIPHMSVYKILKHAGEPTRPRTILAQLSEQERRALHEQWRTQYTEQGWTLARIAEESGVHLGTVSRTLHDIGVEINPPSGKGLRRPSKYDSRIADLIERHRAGDTVSTISTLMGIPESTVYSIVNHTDKRPQRKQS